MTERASHDDNTDSPNENGIQEEESSDDPHPIGTESVRDSQWGQYQSWLRLQARLQIDAHFRGKFDESDIAQQTMIEAWRSQSNFEGESEGQRLAWLRKILARVLGHEMRRYAGTRKRDIAREQSIEHSIAESSRLLGAMLPGQGPSPSEIVAQRESERILADTLERLPPEYREVIIRKNFQSQSHEEIAAAMDRSVAAVRMLWLRALRALRREAQQMM